MAYSLKGFRGLVRCHRGWKHGGVQADTVLEEELRTLHLDRQATGSKCHTGLYISS